MQDGVYPETKESKLSLECQYICRVHARQAKASFNCLGQTSRYTSAIVLTSWPVAPEDDIKPADAFVETARCFRFLRSNQCQIITN